MIGGVLPLGDATATMNMASGMPALTSGVNIDKTARDFEAMFATQLLQPMFETVPVDGTFGGGHGEEVMRSFMLQEYGKIIAQKGTLGIADKVKAAMLRAKEGARGAASSASAAKAYAGTQGEETHVAQ